MIRCFYRSSKTPVIVNETRHFAIMIVPLSVPDDDPVGRFSVRSIVNSPLAPAKRPVPPVIVPVSSIVTKSALSVGVACPTTDPAIWSPVRRVKHERPFAGACREIDH